MASSETKRAHYVPHTYLKNFSNKTQGKKSKYFIDTLEKSSILKENRLRESISIRDICIQKNLYALEGETEEERQLIENYYSSAIESKYTHIYNLLVNPDKSKLSVEERVSIIKTVITMYYRNAIWVNGVNSFWEEIIRRGYDTARYNGEEEFFIEDKKVLIKGKSIEEVLKETSGNQNVMALTQLQVSIKLIKMRLKSDTIHVVEIDDKDISYIISDNPVNMTPINLGHTIPVDPSNIISLPIDSKHLLILMPEITDDLHTIRRRKMSSPFSKWEFFINISTQEKNAHKFLLGKKDNLEKATYVFHNISLGLKKGNKLRDVKNKDDLLYNIKILGF